MEEKREVWKPKAWDVSDCILQYQTKIDWYREMIDIMKREASGTNIMDKQTNLLTVMETVNLELALDQVMVSDVMFSGASGMLLKKTELFSTLLDDISYRMGFYIQTHIRGA